MLRMFLVAATGVVLLLTACVGAAGKRLPAAVVYTGQHCGGQGGPGVSLVSDASALRALVGGDMRHRIGAPSAVPEVDFDKRLVLHIGMGERPSAGYALRWMGAHVSGDALTVQVEWTEPAPGMMTAQVITRPCMLVAVPRRPLEAIRVVDAQGRLRAELRMADNP